ncbi:MAG: hypothetical protein LUC94_06905 [Clostridiales bacterium]|nr:hypothetical protein [Clostridiales bacterium]
MNLKNKLRNCSLKYKILILMLSALFVLFAAEMFSLFLVSRSYEKKLYRSVASSLSSSSSQISEELERIDTMVDTMLANTTIQHCLSSALKSTRISERQSWLSQAYSALCDSYFVFDHDYISWVSIVQNEDRISTSNRDFQTLPRELTDRLITDARQADGKTTIVTDYSTSYGLFIIT